MARCRADGGVPQAVVHGAEIANRFFQLLRFGGEHLTIDARAPIRAEHHCDLVEREACGTAQGDQSEAFQDGRSE